MFGNWAKTILKRHHLVEKQINFEFAALFHLPNKRVKKRVNFKSNLIFDQMEAFLYCLGSKLKFVSLLNTIFPLKCPHIEIINYLIHKTSYEAESKTKVFTMNGLFLQLNIEKLARIFRNWSEINGYIFRHCSTLDWTQMVLGMYRRVGGIFPPDIYQIPWNVCTLAQHFFEWNIPMGVGYNGIK